jgi:hypothetical protein
MISGISGMPSKLGLEKGQTLAGLLDAKFQTLDAKLNDYFQALDAKWKLGLEARR